jgi:hypothetical protein
MDNSLLVDLLIEDFGDGVKYGWYAIVFLSMCSVETKKLNHMASGSFYVRKAERPGTMCLHCRLTGPCI